jgi:hypothetical protein
MLDDPFDEGADAKYDFFLFGCTHEHKHLCGGTEELMHLLFTLGLKSPYEVLKKIGISVEGKRYFWNGQLIDTGTWKER